MKGHIALPSHNSTLVLAKNSYQRHLKRRETEAGFIDHLGGLGLTKEYRIAGNFSEIETLTIFASRHENAKV